jgi:branched-chain amino acid transport system substrate-binding protein
MKKIWLIVFVITLVSGLIFVSCGEPATTPTTAPATTTAPTSTAPEKTEILIGAINSMTGVEAMVGTEHRWAYQLAVNDINAAGGVYVKELGKSLPMRLIVVDDKSSIPDAAAGVEKLIKLENVDFILGSVSSELNVSGYSVAEKYKKLYITTTHWAEQHKESVGQGASWIVTSFFAAASVVESPALALNTMPMNECPQKICVMAMDNPDGKFFGEAGPGEIGKYGYNVIPSEYYTEGQKDYSASILRFKSEGVDGLVWIGSSADGITLVRQMKENNYNLKYVHGMKGFWPVEFAETLGPDSDYIVHDGHWAEGLGYGKSAEIAAKFAAEFNGATSVTIGNFYSLVEALAQAIEVAGSTDSAKVRDVFYSGTFVAKNTTNGDLAFDNTGLYEIPPVALQWMGGKRMPVLPTGAWTLKWMPPWNER